MKKVMLGAVAAGLALGMGGCRKGLIVEGKVIVGDVPFVLVVDRTDPRLSKDGVAGVRVAGRMGGGTAADESLGETVTDRKGAFSMRVPQQTAISKPIEFRTFGEGFMPTVGQIPAAPAGDRAVLILVKRATP